MGKPSIGGDHSGEAPIWRSSSGVGYGLEVEETCIETLPTKRIKGMSSREPLRSSRKSSPSISNHRGCRGDLSLSLGVGEIVSESESGLVLKT